MSSPFAIAGNELLTALDAAAGEAIVYSRPGTAIALEIDAVPGQTKFDAFDGDGFPTTVRSKDWVFPAGELLSGGVPVEPSEGDEVRWTDPQGTTHVFRALPFGQDREIWRYADAAQLRLRVHTKRMGTE